MNSGLASLHKILKDETRRKIVLLLNEKGSLSYTDLMDILGIVSTGTLNYHLKILDDLLAKNETGQYMLTEKGKLSSRLLLEFPEENRKQFGLKPKWWRKFWIAAGSLAVVSLTIHMAAFFLGYIDLSMLFQSLVWIIAAIGIFYMVEHITREVLPEKTRSKINKVGYFARGLVIGFLLWFALIFVLVLSGLSRQISSALGEAETFFIIASLIICCVIGAFINKWQVKRNYLLL
jgi:DNA-binding transcriptional ArsR family regulator